MSSPSPVSLEGVAVVCVGARTPVGLDALQTAFLLRAGFPAVAESALSNAAGEPITAAFVPTIDEALTGEDRLAALAEPALAEATRSLGDLRTQVSIAIDARVPAVPRPVALAAACSRVLPSAALRIEPAGAGGVARWIPSAVAALRDRTVDAVVLGGVHSDHDPAVIAALEAGGRLFSRDDLDARVPGEAAAFFVVMRAQDAARRGLQPLSRVLGVGTGHERAGPENDHPAYEALGLTAAVREATAPLVAAGRTAGWLLTDLTFEMWRQHEWQSVWVRSQAILGDPYVIEAPAQRIGHLGAAALPLFVVMASLAFSHGHAPSPVALALAGSDGGARAALVLAAP